MKEYELLRTEIMSDLETLRVYNNLLFTVVTAILAFTIDSNFFLASMIPYIVIVSMFQLLNISHRGICKVGTYLSVFLEGDEHNWETRTAKFDVESLSHKKDPFRVSYLLRYYLLSVICSSITVYKLFNSKSMSNYALSVKYSIGALIVLFTIGICYYYYRNAFSYIEQRDKMMRIWAEIKSKEESEGDNMSHNLNKNDSDIKMIIGLTSLVVEKSLSKEEAVEALGGLISNRPE